MCIQEFRRLTLHSNTPHKNIRQSIIREVDIFPTIITITHTNDCCTKKKKIIYNSSWANEKKFETKVTEMTNTHCYIRKFIYC